MKLNCLDFKSVNGTGIETFPPKGPILQRTNFWSEKQNYNISTIVHFELWTVLI